MKAIDDGFVYDLETKEIITEFQKGNEIYTSQGIFYGTKDEAIEFGLIFNEQ